VSVFARLAAALVALAVAVPLPAVAQTSGAVTARLIDGTEVSSGLASFDLETLRLGGGESRPARVLPVGQVLSLRLAKRGGPPAPPAVLEFANGDRIACEVLSVDDDLLRASFAGAGLDVPLETLRGIALTPPGPADGAAALFLRERGDDLVLLTNGDRLSGQFAGLSEAELRLEAGGRETRVPRDRVAAVAFSPDLVAPAEIDGPRQIVRSAAGWLTVRDLRRDGESWAATTAFGEEVAWPAGEVDRIWFAGERAEFLSEIAPAHVEFVPYLDRRWPLRRDRDVTGEPLVTGGEVIPKGLGTHSRSRVTYDLGGRYASFRAVAAVSPSAGDAGSAEFAVEVDGREVYRSGPVTAADAEPVAVDLTGAERLTLAVDFGRNGDVLDRANWCDAVLVKN